jgi:phytoene dehydrogenase-like protein
MGLPPADSRALDFSYLWFDYIKNGGYYLEKGSYVIVDALVKYIKSKGGEFLFKKTADRILVKDKYCQKVKFDKDEAICNVLISNMDLHKTINNLIGAEEYSPKCISRLNSIEPSISAFEIFLGLDTDLRSLYPDDYEIFVNSSYDIEGQYKASLDNNAEKAPFIITINSNLNRFSAPKEKSVVTIIMLSGYDYWTSKSRNEYEEKKQYIADILIKRAGKIFPEIKSNIQKKIISTPLTFERYTNNSKGAIYGYARNLNGPVEIRPNAVNKIKNLYFASAWARQGSGVMKVLQSADEVCGQILQENAR